MANALVLFACHIAAYQELKVIRFHSDVALLKVDEKDCFVFSFGCLVCWGCTPQEAGQVSTKAHGPSVCHTFGTVPQVNSARESVRNFLKEPLAPAQVETDNLDIAGGDALPVCHKAGPESKDTRRKKAVANNAWESMGPLVGWCKR